ncbi:unnamed protein product [Urochloa humidicola]
MTTGEDARRSGGPPAATRRASAVESGKGRERVCGGGSGWSKACCCGSSKEMLTSERATGAEFGGKSARLRQQLPCWSNGSGGGSNGSGGGSSRELLPSRDSDDSTARELLELARELNRAEPSWLFCSCR